MTNDGRVLLWCSKTKTQYKTKESIMIKKRGMSFTLRRAMFAEDRLIKKIDRKSEQGKYNEEDHKVANAMTVKEDGSRCWSF